jgi:hypothetical protein
MKPLMIVAFGAMSASTALAQIVVDGTAEVGYGEPLVLQTLGTGFGNATQGNRAGPCGGSELDGAFAKIDVAGGFLYLVLAGNLETNFNKFELFIDCAAGGQNVVRNNNPDVDYNGLNRMGTDAASNAPGLRFDAGFESDFYVTCTMGGTPVTVYSNYAQMLTEGGGTGNYIGSNAADAATQATLIDDPVSGIQLSVDNSNVAGVDGVGGSASSGAGVRTGIEVRIPLALMGYAGGPIKVCAFINGQGHDFASNQFLGPLPAGYGNMGEPRQLDLQAHDGDQFFVINPGSANTCPADINRDSEVNGDDLALLLTGWGPCTGTACPADLNGDASVDGDDLATLLTAWGSCPS